MRTIHFTTVVGAICIALFLGAISGGAWFFEKGALGPTANEAVAGAEPSQPQTGKLVPLNKQQTILLDADGGRVLLKTKVVLRAGVLEMLCCLKQTKEHEAILALDGEASIVHAGLLAIKAEPGRPVQFFPEFEPPQGQKIDIFLQWRDAQGKLHRQPAQTWVRRVVHRYYVANLDERPSDLQIPEDSGLRFDDKHGELIWYGPMTDPQRDKLLALSKDRAYQSAIRTFYKDGQSRQMEARWVFAGSEFFVDEQTGDKFYMAESGDLICVANFPSATIDVAVASTASGEENLLYEAWTERVPPLDTEVTIELIPVKDEEARPE